MNQRIEISGAEARAIIANFFHTSLGNVLHYEKDAEGRPVVLPMEEFDRTSFVVTKSGVSIFAERYQEEDCE